MLKVLGGPLSFIYGALVRLRNALYNVGFIRAKTLPGKVISVGNIVAGGTGKSPVTIELAELLLGAGAKPVILTRGYRSGLGKHDSLALRDGELLMPPHAATGTWALPDEARMQSTALPSVPVVVGRKRYAAAQRFLAAHPDLAPTHWLLDDGFQHRRIKRDLDIVLLDATRPFATGKLLPSGLLREPLAGLRRAGVILLTRAHKGDPSASTLNGIRQYSGAPVIPAAFLSGPLAQSVDGAVTFKSSDHLPIIAVCGIANPSNFVADLTKSLGTSPKELLSTGDHVRISRQSLLERLVGVRSIVTTAKDYWRDPSVFADLPVPVFVLPLQIVWDEDLIAKCLRPLL